MKTMLRPPNLPKTLLCIALGVALMTLSAYSAQAKTVRQVSHSYENVWPAAVRFLRIDEGLNVVEKDKENGYLLFEIAEEGKVFFGSVEVVRTKDGRGRDAVRLTLHIKDRPKYMEYAIVDRMLVKIRKELGVPKERAPADKEEEEDKKGDKAPKEESVE